MKYFFVCPDIRHIRILNELDIEVDALLSYIYIVPVYGQFEGNDGKIKSGMKGAQPTHKILQGKVKNALLKIIQRRSKRRRIKNDHYNKRI